MLCILIWLNNKTKTMSRVGNNPIIIPEGTTVVVDKSVVSVKGKLGELFQEINSKIIVQVKDGIVTLSRSDDQKQSRSYHGLYRALISNMIEGVSKGFEKRLELVGVGYRASNQGQKLDLSVGYSHNIIFELPDIVKVNTETVKGEPPVVILNSIDKQMLGMVASKIRALRKPEQYKGKGIRYKGEYIRRKAGKTAAA